MLIIGILLIAGTANAKHLHPEKYYQDLWCADRGQVEVRQEDGTRVDCLTECMAVEFDFCGKWYESITQALHYGMLTGKQAAIVLIVEKPGDWKYVERAKALIKFYCLPVVVFVTTPKGIIQSGY